MIPRKIRFKHVMQHPGSRLCGHAVLAMARETSLKHAIDLLGHERITKTRELITCLGELTTATKLTPMRGRDIWDLPNVSIIRVRWHVGSNNGHFVLRDGPYIHDPMEAGPYPIAVWDERIEPHGAPTSFLPLTIARPLPEVGDEYVHPLHGRQVVTEVLDRGEGRFAIVSESTEKDHDGRPLVSVNTSVRRGKGSGFAYKPAKNRYSVLSED